MQEQEDVSSEESPQTTLMKNCNLINLISYLLVKNCMILLEHLFKMPFIITIFFLFLLSACFFIDHGSILLLMQDQLFLFALLVLTIQQMRYASL